MALCSGTNNMFITMNTCYVALKPAVAEAAAIYWREECVATISGPPIYNVHQILYYKFFINYIM